jgi:putative endonuclease
MLEFDPAPFQIHIMYYVYLLKSKKDNSLYIGYTNNIKRRLQEHNEGKVRSTRDNITWEVIYYEAFISLEDARKRERSLKYFGKAYGQLKGRINKSLNT